MTRTLHTPFQTFHPDSCFFRPFSPPPFFSSEVSSRGTPWVTPLPPRRPKLPGRDEARLGARETKAERSGAEAEPRVQRRPTASDTAPEDEPEARATGGDPCAGDDASRSADGEDSSAVPRAEAARGASAADAAGSASGVGGGGAQDNGGNTFLLVLRMLRPRAQCGDRLPFHPLDRGPDHRRSPFSSPTPMGSEPLLQVMATTNSTVIEGLNAQLQSLHDERAALQEEWERVAEGQCAVEALVAARRTSSAWRS